MSWQTFRGRVKEFFAEPEESDDVQEMDAFYDDVDEDDAGPQVLHINFTDPDDEPYVDYELRAALKAARRAQENRRSVPLR